MPVVLIVHAMLEFPLDYAYFLFPLGVILGYLQSYDKLSVNFLNKKNIYVFFPIYVVLLILVWLDYGKIVSKTPDAVNAGLSQNHNYKLNANVYILDQLERELYLISIPKNSILSDAELMEIEYTVAMNTNFFNLIKYSQLLCFNNKNEKLNKQLGKIYLLYGYRVDLNILMKLKI